MPETPRTSCSLHHFQCAKMHYTQILPPPPLPPLLLFSGLGRGARGAVSQYVVAVVAMAAAAVVVVVVASSSPEFLQVPHCVVLRRGVLRTSCLSQGRMSIIDSWGQFGFFLFFEFFFIFFLSLITLSSNPSQVVDMVHPPSSSSFLLL